MTDTASTPPAVGYDKTLVAETTYERRGFFLPAFAMHHLNAGQTVITGKTFIECIIEGPAILMATAGTEFDGCALGSTADPKNLFLRSVGEKITGVVAFGDTRFIRCKFNRVGYTSSDEFIDGMIASLNANPAPPEA